MVGTFSPQLSIDTIDPVLFEKNAENATKSTTKTSEFGQVHFYD